MSRCGIVVHGHCRRFSGGTREGYLFDDEGAVGAGVQREFHSGNLVDKKLVDIFNVGLFAGEVVEFFDGAIFAGLVVGSAIVFVGIFSLIFDVVEVGGA